VRAGLSLALAFLFSSSYAPGTGGACKQKAESPRPRYRRPGLPTTEINARPACRAPNGKNSSGLEWCQLHGRVVALLYPGVRVKARHPEVDCEVRKHHSAEARDQHDCRSRAGPVAEATHVQVDAVDEPGDERGGLFRVPSPVTAPSRVRPVGA